MDWLETGSLQPMLDVATVSAGRRHGDLTGGLRKKGGPSSDGPPCSTYAFAPEAGTVTSGMSSSLMTVRISPIFVRSSSENR